MKSCPVFCRWFFAFFPALILLAPGIAFSAVLTVGADQPYATIAGALDAVQGDSDVIRIMDPVHTESSIKIRKNVTIEGLGAYDTIVQAHAQPGMASDRVFTVDINTTVTLRDMTIRHGRVVGVSPEGGGILNMGALALYGCHIIDNRVEADTECFAVGGGIHNHFNAKSLWLEECRISGNVCAAQPGVSANCYGGGIYSMAPLTLVNCLLEGNQARDSGTLTSVGGGLATQNFPVFLSGCSFLSNFSRDIAGGISILGQDLTLENCTLSGNVAALEYGGGVCLSGVKNCQIINSTIVENQASADKGGGLAVLDTAAVFIQNSILCHNGGEDYLLRYGGTLVSGGYNLAGTDPLSLFTASGDIVGSDPLLGPPALNGGLIPTRALLPGSPCMDVIPSDYLPTDQRGVSRPQGRLGDMGAFEVLEGPDLGFLSGILDLGSWPVNRGESAPVSFPVINIGKLTLPAIALSLDSGKEFKISGEQVREINLAPGETGQIALIFDPADTGLRADTLSIDNPPSHTLSLSIPVMGTGYNTRPVAGKYEPDQVLQFRETMQQHVQIPDAPAFNLTFKFTLEAWVRPSFKGWETILSRGDGNQNEKTSYIFSIEEGTRRLALMAAGAWHYSTKSVPMGKWTHVAVSYDGQDKRFFINGEPDSTVSCPGSIYGSVDSIYIGRQGTECNCNFFDGFMDEVRIWHRALDAQEIKSRMNVSFSGPETGLIGCWNFNWIQGQETPDSSGFNHNGTLVNAPLPQSLPDSPMTRIIGAYDLFTDEDTDLEVPLFASDADSDEPLDVMITCLPEPRHGRLFQFTGNWPVRGERITQPGTRITDPEKRLVFAPANRREGYDVILRWKAHDGWEESDNPTTITINVAADNDPPVAGIPLPGCGVIFNKGARQYVSVKAAPSLETPFAFTVEAWVKSSLHEWNTIISRGNGNDNLLTSYIFSLEGETGRLGLSAGGEWHYSESSIPPGVW
ncbi:MAG TPA: choice-of-anchor Q domain-containing protein, partial [Candidatus Sumerlaeota bacterium]|nr:choice-of-anchor Q domain-containing protein [Candidatus Sumerlaeota bacterium]